MNSKEYANEENWRKAIVEAQKGDRKIRDALVSENMGLVYMVAKRFQGRGVEEEELTQIGAIGLIKAIDKFDPKLPYSFSTYAVPMIMGEIRRFLRDDNMIHISRQVKGNARKIAIVKEKMKKTENKDPTLEELQRETGLSYEDLVVAMESSVGVESISKPVAGEDSAGALTIADQLEDKKPFEGPILNRIALQQVMDELDEGEVRLISLRYMQNHTQAEVAQILGTNQVAVSRQERRILGKLRKKLA